MSLPVFAVAVFTLLLLYYVSRKYLGFTSQAPHHYSNVGRQFDIREALQGPLICEGVIYGPLGRVTSRFVAEMQAEWNGNTGHMTEEFRYDSGETMSREWHLNVAEDGSFEATAPDIIGRGKGKQAGSGVQLFYTLKLPENAGGHALNVTDWMYMMENGSIMNRSQMRKFGIKVAELIATMRKAD